MSKTTLSSASLSARQKARLATQAAREALEAREKALTSVFTALDRRDDVDREIGAQLVAAKSAGLSNSDLARQTGLSSKEISTLVTLVANNDSSQGDFHAGEVDDHPAEESSSPESWQ